MPCFAASSARCAQRVERLGDLVLLADAHRERRRAEELDEARVRLAQLRVDRRGEQLDRDGDVVCGRRLGLDHPDADDLVVVVDDRERVAVLADRGERAVDVRRRLDLVLDQPVQHHQLGRGRPEVGAQPRVVALVLLQRAS